MDKIDIVVAHSLAAQYLGHRFVYLECGSNSKKKIDLNLLINHTEAQTYQK